MKTAASLTVALTLTTAIASAAPVAIKSDDGLINLRGEIVGFNDQTIEIQSALGLVSVPTSGMYCIGSDCPTQLVAAPLDGRIRLFLGDHSLRDFAAVLVGAYATSENGTMTREDDLAGQTEFKILDDSQSNWATIEIVDTPMDADITLETRVAFSQQPADIGKGQVVGLSAFAVITSPDVSFDALSMEDLAAIYAGDIYNWAQLGGPDLPITSLIRERGSAARDEFAEMVMAPYGKSIDQLTVSAHSEERIAYAVDTFRGTIGVVNAGDLAGATAVKLQGSCGIVSSLDKNTVKFGQYPLVREIVAKRNGELSPLGDGFLAYAISNKGQSDISGLRYVGQEVEHGDGNLAIAGSQTAGDQGASDDNQALIRSIAGSSDAAYRVSPTFRVAADVSAADSEEIDASFDRLVDYISENELKDVNLVFAGFSAPSSDALQKSEDLAANVLDAFQERLNLLTDGKANVEMVAKGLGDANPVVCDNDPMGNFLNQRVEVWIQ